MVIDAGTIWLEPLGHQICALCYVAKCWEHSCVSATWVTGLRQVVWVAAQFGQGDRWDMTRSGIGSEGILPQNSHGHGHLRQSSSMSTMIFPEQDLRRRCDTFHWVITVLGNCELQRNAPYSSPSTQIQPRCGSQTSWTRLLIMVLAGCLEGRLTAFRSFMVCVITRMGWLRGRGAVAASCISRPDLQALSHLMP